MKETVKTPLQCNFSVQNHKLLYNLDILRSRGITLLLRNNHTVGDMHFYCFFSPVLKQIISFNDTTIKLTSTDSIPECAGS